MTEKIKKLARIGFVAKGVVYGIIGVLTLMAALNMGGEKSSNIQVLKFLDEQAFGNILLVLMGLGLLCYAGWRFLQAVKDPENIGDDKKGKAKRAAFFISGLLYLGLAGLAFYRVVKAGGASNQGGSGSTQSSFLASDTGLIFLGIVGAGIIIAGIFQFVKAYKNDYTKKFDLSTIDDKKKRESIKKTAKFGLSSRGVVFLIMGFFALQAAIGSDPSEIKTTSEAFSFIQDSSYGGILLALVAAGFVAYAAYMMLMAKYRRFHG